MKQTARSIARRGERDERVRPTSVAGVWGSKVAGEIGEAARECARAAWEERADGTDTLRAHRSMPARVGEADRGVGGGAPGRAAGGAGVGGAGAGAGGAGGALGAGPG